MNFLVCLETSASGLYAQRKRMDIIASNLANIETTRTENGGPYRRKMVVMSTKPPNQDFGDILNSTGDANDEGYLLKPNIDLVVETTNMIMAKRAFEANIAAIKATRKMAIKALEIGR
jgi:flagellar basal-body rod protein FlgC